jgi:hypothetical protein
VTATPTDDDDNGNGCTSRVYMNYCLPATGGAPFWVASVRTSGGTFLEEQVVSSGTGRIGFDVPNNADLELWVWNEVDGGELVAEFFSGYCEYPEVWIDLCRDQPTPTPTPKIPEYLPETGGERPSSGNYLLVIVPALIGTAILGFGIVKYLYERAKSS